MAQVALVVEKALWGNGCGVQVRVPISQTEQAGTPDRKYHDLFIVVVGRVQDHGLVSRP